ncbi:MAG: nucleotidyl transferase AbiEii/AbiGii toxin family protein [Bacteroidales bacterium]|nr:nucleotidyl transferase AbiEii/AbiGii toxin family protein [Bacteroidales bacterium]
MVNKGSFTEDWIEKVSSEMKYPDKNLIEKVIRAFSLVELLAESGCPFIWKGGTSLMLILGQQLHRLSIDVDIICPPGTNINEYLKNYEDYGFVSKEEEYREQRSTDIPKSHSKFHYQIAYKGGMNRNEYILLDVLYEDSHYSRVNNLSLEHPFVKCDEEAVKVCVPSADDILGDKLTAFAPNTSGIPYFKNGQNRHLEIIKQLYDIGRLFDAVIDINCVKKAYSRIIPVEMSYRNLPTNSELALDDTIETAKCLATRGKTGMGNFEALQDGINRLKSFMYLGKYYIEQASTDATKAAYLAAIIKYDISTLEKYDSAKPIVKSKKKMPSVIAKMYMGNPEAYFYWSKYAEIEDI